MTGRTPCVDGLSKKSQSTGKCVQASCAGSKHTRPIKSFPTSCEIGLPVALKETLAFFFRLNSNLPPAWCRHDPTSKQNVLLSYGFCSVFARRRRTLFSSTSLAPCRLRESSADPKNRPASRLRTAADIQEVMRESFSRRAAVPSVPGLRSVIKPVGYGPSI